MASKHVIYKGFPYTLAKEDKNFVILESQYGSKIKVPKEEVIYGKEKEDKIEEAPKEDKMVHPTEVEKNEPLPSAVEDKGFVTDTKPEEDKPKKEQNPNQGEVEVGEYVADYRLKDELAKLRLEMKSNLKALDEDAGGAAGAGPVATSGPATSTAGIANFDAKLGAKPENRKLYEDVMKDSTPASIANLFRALELPLNLDTVNQFLKHNNITTVDPQAVINISNPQPETAPIQEDGDVSNGGGGSVGMSAPAGVPQANMPGTTTDDIALYMGKLGVKRKTN